MKIRALVMMAIIVLTVTALTLWCGLYSGCSQTYNSR